MVVLPIFIFFFAGEYYPDYNEDDDDCDGNKGEGQISETLFIDRNLITVQY